MLSTGLVISEEYLIYFKHRRIANWLAYFCVLIIILFYQLDIIFGIVLASALLFLSAIWYHYTNYQIPQLTLDKGLEIDETRLILFPAEANREVYLQKDWVIFLVKELALDQPPKKTIRHYFFPEPVINTLTLKNDYREITVHFFLNSEYHRNQMGKLLLNWRNSH